MKKLLTLASFFMLSTFAFSQSGRNEMNKEYGKQYKEIGKNPHLSEDEKKQQKRELGINQRHDNINYNNSHESNDKQDLYTERKKEEIDRKIDQLEKSYKRDKERIENNDQLTKNQIKTQKSELDKIYKDKKNVLIKEKKLIIK